MNHTLIAALLLAQASGLSAQERPKGTSAPAPALPYHAKTKCPFEGCVYREWTARKEMPVFDTLPEASRQTGTLRKGEKVTALGGAVIIYRPGLIHVDRDVPESGLKRGDSILTYTDLGEGYSQVWVNGRFYDEFDVSFAKLPDGTGCGGAHCAATYLDIGKKAWWAQLRLKSGAIAWVNMEGIFFDGVSVWDNVEPPTTAR